MGGGEWQGRVREKETDTDTDRQTDRQTDREREKETEKNDTSIVKMIHITIIDLQKVHLDRHY